MSSNLIRLDGRELLKMKVAGFMRIYEQAPDQSYTKTNQDDTIYAVYDMNIMRRKFLPDLSGQHHLKKIARKNNGKTGNKNHQSLLYRVTDKCSGGGKPEYKNSRIQRVHKETGEK